MKALKILGAATKFAALAAVAFSLNACGGEQAVKANKDMNEKVEGLQKTCLKNDTQACKKIFEIYKQECDKDNGIGCLRLGYAYLGGKDNDYAKIARLAGESKDTIQAITYLKKSCDLGWGDACWKLGVEYAKSDTEKAEQLYAQAISIYEKRCNDGNPPQCFNAGIYHYGKNDYQKALPLFKKACDGAKDKDEVRSCSFLGTMYYQSEGVAQDYEEAKKYYKKVCDMGMQSGCDDYKMVNEKSKK